MYVKVTFGEGMGGDFLMELPAKTPLHSGYYSIPWDPEARDHDIMGELGNAISTDIEGAPKDEMEDEYHRSFFSQLQILEIDESQTHYEKTRGWLAVKCLWWIDPDGGGTYGVATTRNIFIVGDNGKTIDRV